MWVGGYELDLVAARGRTVVFCEVKSKRGAGFGDPLEMVGPEKIRRIRRAAELWLVGHPAFRAHAVRFDVVAVRGGKLQCLQAAF